jgi:predicted aspartyl protease
MCRWEPVVRVVGALLATVVVVPPALHAADHPRAELGSTHLSRGTHGEAIVEVTVAPGRSVRALVDTGSTHTSISSGLLGDLALPVVAKTEVRTAAGVSFQPVARLERLTLAGVGSSHLLVSVVPQHLLSRDSTIQVVVGQDVLAIRPFSLQFTAGRFAWHRELPLQSRGTTLTLELEDGRFVARVPQAGGTLRLVPDSGAEALVFFDPAAVPVRTTVTGDVWVETVTGRQLAQMAVVPRLMVGKTTLTNVPAALLPGRRPGARSLDGLLPLSLFGRVTVDGPGRRIVLER